MSERMTQSLFNYPTIYFEWCVVFTKRMYLHRLHLISSNRTCDALYSTAAACRSIVRPVSLAGPCRRDQLETGTARLTGYGAFCYAPVVWGCRLFSSETLLHVIWYLHLICGRALWQPGLSRPAAEYDHRRKQDYWQGIAVGQQGAGFV